MTSLQNTLFGLLIIFLTINAVLCENNDRISDLENDNTLTEARTFGHHFLKRISFAMIPAAFIVGVITTLLAALTIVSMKGLGIGVILLVLAVSQILARGLPQITQQPIAYSAAPPPIPIVYKDW